MSSSNARRGKKAARREKNGEDSRAFSLEELPAPPLKHPSPKNYAAIEQNTVSTLRIQTT